MLLAASSSSCSSQPDSYLEEPAEDVEAETNLEFQFALYKNEQSDLDFS